MIKHRVFSFVIARTVRKVHIPPSVTAPVKTLTHPKARDDEGMRFSLKGPCARCLPSPLHFLPVKSKCVVGAGRVRRRGAHGGGAGGHAAAVRVLDTRPLTHPLVGRLRPRHPWAPSVCPTLPAPRQAAAHARSRDPLLWDPFLLR